MAKSKYLTEAEEGEIYRVLSDSCECNKINTVKLFEVINQQLQTAYDLGEAKGIEQGASDVLLELSKKQTKATPNEK